MTHLGIYCISWNDINILLYLKQVFEYQNKSPHKVTLKKILLDRVGNGNGGPVFQSKIGEFASKDTTSEGNGNGDPVFQSSIGEFASRDITNDEELAAKVLKRYKGKMSSNVKKVGEYLVNNLTKMLM